MNKLVICFLVLALLPFPIAADDIHGAASRGDLNAVLTFLAEGAEVSGDTQIEVTLALSRQPFTVIPTPSSARVRLLNHDGRYRAGMELPPGTYHIRVTATGYQTEELTIRHGDQPTRERISLQPFATHCVDPLSGNYCQLGVGVFLLRGAACSCYGYGGQTLFNGVAQ